MTARFELRRTVAACPRSPQIPARATHFVASCKPSSSPSSCLAATRVSPAPSPYAHASKPTSTRKRSSREGRRRSWSSSSTWSDVTWRNWRRRVFAPAAAKAELGPTARPYHLRHSFVSLLLLEGATVVEVARQAGHSPTMTLSTYAHLFEELEGVETR